jgi:alkanesulfonate monooxygenase SsuD/methylene tetrahydromethanopterin reductase-like flavin-dependent oxidoreductase (luciferase family)
VDFLPPAAADAFALRGGPEQIAERLAAVIRAAATDLEYVVLHPMPNPPTPDDPERGYTARMAREVLPRVRRTL